MMAFEKSFSPDERFIARVLRSVMSLPVHWYSASLPSFRTERVSVQLCQAILPFGQLHPCLGH